MRTTARFLDHPAVRLAGPLVGLACAGVFVVPVIPLPTTRLLSVSLAAAFVVALHVAVLAPVAVLWALLTARARLRTAPARVR